MKASLGCLARLFVVLIALGCVQSLYATSYNVVTGFSSATNPNGVWTYDYNGAAYSNSQGYSSLSSIGLPGWWSGEPVPNSLVILQNVTGSTVSYLTVRDPTNTLWMDPESGSVSVVLTAPSTGTYKISGAFLGIDIDENSHPVEILDNGSIVWSGTISSFSQHDSFSFLETFNAGSTITFYVGTGSSGCSYCFLSTGLQGTITAGGTATTPEPGTLILLGSGLFGLVFMFRARHFVRS
ncbi:MAG: PEP-CTERM sorting domain-containing protein [Candidatus Sulfotelmatobacter sp.]